MKTKLPLEKGWCLRSLEPATSVDPAAVAAEDTGTWLSVDTVPAEVHDILLAHGKLDPEYRLGWCESAAWVTKLDWLYRLDFDCETPGVRTYLRFGGLDTFADIYLNGVLIGTHNDFYVSDLIDVTGTVAVHNTLLLHFHNALGVLDELEQPEKWAHLDKCKLLRKSRHDFPADITEGSTYQGIVGYHTPVGIYETVELILADAAEITCDEIRAALREDLVTGALRVRVDGACHRAGTLGIKVLLYDPEGAPVGETAGSAWGEELTIPVTAPRLWWPAGYGAHPLYRAEVEVTLDGRLCDRVTKDIGFRYIEQPYSMGFRINGKPVRLWGGSMDPFQAHTYVWQHERAWRILDMAENAHVNILRIWGEGGVPYRDEFYDECDRRGILVWQEFFHGHGMFPDSEEYRKLYRREGRELILRLRHHACLLMWCGGNECVMGSEFYFRDMPVIGKVVLQEDYPALLAELDPGRYYHLSSPTGGEWANDPRVGDYHTYDCIWQYPFHAYPNFISEDIRTSPPVLHSLRRMIRGDVWPDGYDGKFSFGDRFPMPENWMQRSNHGAQGHVKTGPYWEYYDADNATDHIYRFGASYAQVLRDNIERVRMGGPTDNLPPALRSKGHLSCKFNDTWPKCYCATIDYFHEGFHPYYATLRGYAPVILCFDIGDEIKLWLVNDSARPVRGTVYFALFDMAANAFTFERRVPVEVADADGKIVLDLNDIQYFQKTLLPYARFEDADGNVVCTAVDYCDVERHYAFPDARLDVALEGDELVIRTDRFARCVEILGTCDGDPFGWLFSDNYFDLVPGDEKRVKVLGKLPHGTISLRPHYASHTATVEFVR